MTIIHLQKRLQKAGFRVLRVQIAITLGLALLFSWLSSVNAALNVCLGGLTAVIPNGYFAYIFFRKTGALDARRIARAMYLAEFGKLVISGVLFGLIFYYLPVTIEPFFIGYLAALVALWFSPLYIKTW